MKIKERMINNMAGGAVKKLRKQKIKEGLAKQRADKTVDGLRDMFVNPTEEQLDELSQAIADIALEEKNEEKDEKDE